MYLARIINVVVGTPEIVDLHGFPIPTSINCVPGSGGTLSVEWSMTKTAVSLPAEATWTAWTAGTVSIKTMDVLDAPIVALRVTALIADGTFEMVG